MADFEDLKIVIPAFTPETMPLDRLIEYLQQAAQVIGDPAELHLIGVEKGSTAPVLRLKTSVAVKARENIARVERGEGTQRQADAFRRMRRMVWRDARDAGRPALLRSDSAVLLEIPPAQDTSAISGIRQQTTIDGQLTRIGGVGDYAALQMQDLSGKVLTGISASKSLAKEMAKLIYEPIRISGIGVWCRDEEGQWAIEKMQVQSFEPLDDDDAIGMLHQLRALKVEWPDDALEQLAALRGGGQ